MELVGFSDLSTLKRWQAKHREKKGLEFDAVSSLFVVCASGLAALVFLLQRCVRSYVV